MASYTCMLRTYKDNYFSLIDILSSAPSDYTNSSFPVTFSPDDVTSHILCGNISITADDMAENTEVFSVFLSSSDPAVNLTQTNVPIAILDNSSKYYCCGDSCSFF